MRGLLRTNMDLPASDLLESHFALHVVASRPNDTEKISTISTIRRHHRCTLRIPHQSIVHLLVEAEPKCLMLFVFDSRKSWETGLGEIYSP